MATITLNTDDLTGDTLPDGTPTTTILVRDPRGEIAIEIDLSDDSFKKLLTAVKRYTDKGRPITTPPAQKPSAPNTEAAKARAWAQSHRPDLKVADKGAVPNAALEAYRAFVAENENEDEDEGEGHASEAAINAALTAGENESK